MSKFISVIVDIKSVDNLNIVKFDFFGTVLTMMSLELNSNVKIGSKVILSTKSTAIGIGKDFSSNISYSNQIKAKIISINNGKLLSNIELSIENCIFESIITLESSKRLNLKVEDEVVAFIKASDLYLLEVLDD